MNSVLWDNPLFDNIAYLESGTERQREAYIVLTENEVLSKLDAFTPLLAGTIPINIDIACSDLDIICCWTDKEKFVLALNEQFGHQPGFTIREDNEKKAVIAGFRLGGFDVEVFGQNIPVKTQHAYRHMLIEHELLLKYGEDFRQQVVGLKRQGYKTEPAFARLLGLSGDPYDELLKIDVKSCIFVS